MSIASYNTVSSRAQKLIKPPLSYSSAVICSITNQYNAVINPNGSVLMAIAENKLCNKEMINQMLSLKSFTPEVLNYTASTGQFAFRDTMASFLGDYIFDGLKTNSNHLVITPGCVSALVQLSILLFEAGDSVLIPTPFYPAFIADFINYGDVHSFGIAGEHCSELQPFGVITAAGLEASYATAVAANHPPKAVLLTNPSNPMGTVLSHHELLTAIEWCREKGIHLIVDEIYALSMFYAESDGVKPSITSAFTSVASLLGNNLGDHVHVVWSVSKDLGCSGVRVGVLYSQNASLLQALGSSNDAMQVSNLAQEIVGHVLADRVFMDGFLKENRRLLYQSYSALCRGFEAIGLRVVSAVAGIFAFCDLRSLLTEQTFEAEHALFEALVARGVVFTPGHACHCPIPGFFRVCYAYVSLDSMLEGVRRVKVHRDEMKCLDGL